MDDREAIICGELHTMFFLSSVSFIVFILCHDSGGIRPAHRFVQIYI